MTFIDYEKKEVNCKIVYWGVANCGSVENLQYIFDKADPSTRGKFTSFPLGKDRSMFFDFLPLELGSVRGFTVRFHLYTVVEQASPELRTAVLKGVDAIVFVADSQMERMNANLESLRLLKESLKASGYDIMTIPYVLQLNKRDSPDAVPVEEMKRHLVLKDEPVFEAIADKGIGVFDTLKAVCQLVRDDLTRPS